MDIHTYAAQRLVHGTVSARTQEKIVGLIQYGRQIRPLWISAQHDDPYADWYLLRIERAIEMAHEYMDSTGAELDKLLQSVDTVHIAAAVSLKPVKVPLHFANPFGNMGALLLAEFDRYVRSVLTASHFAFIDKGQSVAYQQRATHGVRSAFSLAFQWKNTGVVREDVLQDNQNAQRARALMGSLPEGALSRTERAKRAPSIRLPGQRDPMERLARLGRSERSRWPKQEVV